MQDECHCNFAFHLIVYLHHCATHKGLELGGKIGKTSQKGFSL